jgi:lysophospholipase L1-like esterase
MKIRYRGRVMTDRAARLLSLALSLFIPGNARSDPGTFDPHTIVFIGSSSIEFWKTLPADFAGHRVLNLGKAGTTYSHLVANVGEWAARYPARRYVIYSGDNDIAWMRSPETVARQFREVASSLKASIPGVRVFVISIKPNVIPTRRVRIGAVRKANGMIASEAAALGGVTFVDTHTAMLGPNGRPRAEWFTIDGIHLNEKGYRLWRDILLPELDRPVSSKPRLVARPVEP